MISGCLEQNAVLGQAQDTNKKPTTTHWSDDASIRLSQIYEANAFRAKRPEPIWSTDQASYRLRETIPGKQSNAWVQYEIESGQSTILDDDNSELQSRRRDPSTSPNQKFSAQVRSGTITIRNKDTGEVIQQIKSDEDRDVRRYDLKWSPDSLLLAFVESDQTEVRLRSRLLPTDPSYPTVEQSRFARVGETIATLRIGIVDLGTTDLKHSHVRWLPLEEDDPDGQQGFYLGQVEWAGNSEELLIEKLSRFRNHRKFMLFDVNQSKSKTIYEEMNNAWAISSQGKNLGLIWIQDGKQFIVISEKDGWRHAHRYTRSGDPLGNLTPGEYDIIERGPVDEKGGWFLFYASPKNGTQRYLYRVPLDGTGEKERLTPDQLPGTHEYNFSPNLQFAFHTHSTLDLPPVTTLISLPDHRPIRIIEENRELRNRVDAWNLTPTEFVAIETEPGISMDALVMKPREFDASKKYPVLVYVYGEPHGQTVLDQWGAGQSLFHRVITDLGYLVVSIDNRGTPAPKGAAWRRSIFGSLGPLSTDDQAAALTKLGSMKSFLDLDRVAIWGWSGGGSNTLNAMFRKPDLYDVGIAVVPKPQPHLYNAWFQEIYMRTRETNAGGYQESAPLHFAEGLRGKLLIMTGSGETNTHMQIIEGLVDRLIQLGKPFDYMVYPNRNHGLSEGPGSRVHVRMLIARYLKENLPHEPRTN